MTCTTGRRVARGAHRRALGLPVAIGRDVTCDLRGSSDAYVATNGGRRVRRRF